MHTVTSTPSFLAQVKKCKLTEKELTDIENTVSDNPEAGTLMAGTGGARKLRHVGRGKGKSGGYRTIHYCGGRDVPVFLLAIYGKDDKDNLTDAEKNELAKVLPLIADAYRENVKVMAAKMKKRR